MGDMGGLGWKGDGSDSYWGGWRGGVGMPKSNQRLLTARVRGFGSGEAAPAAPIPPSSTPSLPPALPTAAGLYLVVNLWPLLCS